jgi:hypothetical protein
MAETPEAVALELVRHIAYVEIRGIGEGFGGARPDRKWLLDTYAECLSAVKNPGERNASDRLTESVPGNRAPSFGRTP